MTVKQGEINNNISALQNQINNIKNELRNCGYYDLSPGDLATIKNVNGKSLVLITVQGNDEYPLSPIAFKADNNWGNWTYSTSYNGGTIVTMVDLNYSEETNTLTIKHVSARDIFHFRINVYVLGGETLN